MKPTIIVSGLTRCGSSLTMQMLHAGGMPISCATGNEAISGEHNSQIEALRAIHLGLTDGAAVKCLDPHRFLIPPGRSYIIFWCCRDFSEQAKSMTKLMRAFGIPANRSATKIIEQSLPKETSECIRILSKLGTIHKVKFEDTLLNPTSIANNIADAVKDVITLDVGKMAEVVVNRSSKNYKGFLELTLI